MPMRDTELEQEAKVRVSDRYTAAELCELLNISVEDIIAEYWDRILDNPEVMKNVGYEGEETDE